MKKAFLLSLLLVAGLVRLSAQSPIGTAHVDFSLGVLSDQNGAAMPDGSMLQIVASYHGTSLALPTAADFLGGDPGATILWQGGLDSTTSGVGGAAVIGLDINVYADGTSGNFITDGSSLFVRWYPGVAGTASSPGVTPFGQYGYSSVTGATLDTTWTVPAAGASIGIAFLTSTAGGSLADAAGEPTNTVGTPVPEPATTAAVLGGIGLVLGLLYRRKRA